VELDPVGASVGAVDPAEYGEPPPPPDEASPGEPAYNNPYRPGQSCFDNFLPLPCEQVLGQAAWRAGGVRSYTVREDIETLTVRTAIGYHWAWGGDGGGDGDVVKTDSNVREIYYTSTHHRLTQTLSFSGFMGGGMSTQQDKIDYPTKGRGPGPNPPRYPSPLPDDCHKFADIVEGLGKRYKNDLRGFYDALWDRFNNRKRPGFDYNEFRSTGFKDSFTDEKPSRPGGNDISPNQVYHYVGGFRAGWWLGETVGRSVAHGHETEYEVRPEGDVTILPDTPNHRADKALFDVAVRHGAQIGFWGVKNPSQLADMIRKDVCK